MPTKFAFFTIKPTKSASTEKSKSNSKSSSKFKLNLKKILKKKTFKSKQKSKNKQKIPKRNPKFKSKLKLKKIFKKNKQQKTRKTIEESQIKSQENSILKNFRNSLNSTENFHFSEDNKKTLTQVLGKSFFHNYSFGEIELPNLEILYESQLGQLFLQKIVLLLNKSYGLNFPTDVEFPENPKEFVLRSSCIMKPHQEEPVGEPTVLLFNDRGIPFIYCHHEKCKQRNAYRLINLEIESLFLHTLLSKNKKMFTKIEKPISQRLKELLEE